MNISVILFQAFIIAFTSNFIPRLVYMALHNNSLDGFLNDSLSVFNTSHFNSSKLPPRTDETPICRYPDYREPSGSEREYQHTNMYWHVLAARLAFVVVFEVIIYVPYVFFLSVV